MGFIIMCTPLILIVLWEYSHTDTRTNAQIQQQQTDAYTIDIMMKQNRERTHSRMD